MSRSRPPSRTVASSSPSISRSPDASRERLLHMASTSSNGPGAIRTAPGFIELNADRTDAERIELEIVNTGDRPVQIGSHLHLPDANTSLEFDRAAAHGYRLDIPSGTSRRFVPGASRVAAAVAFQGNRSRPGIQIKPTAEWEL